MTGDGGGKAPALAQTLHGRARVAGTLISWMSRETRLPGLHMEPAEVNGGPGARYFDREGRLVGVTALAIADGEIKAIHSIANPDKLAHLGPVGNLGWVIAAER
jgi:RNA polymerase sigma-70 factor (ECF subfamily)